MSDDRSQDFPRPVAPPPRLPCSPRPTSPSRRRRPSAASSSSSSAAPPTGSARSRRPAIRPLPGCAARFAQDFAGGAQARRLLHAPSEAGRGRAALSGARGPVRPRRRLALSRPLAFRRPERARDRRHRRLCAARRLDEPAARRCCRRREPAAIAVVGDGADGAARQRARSPPTRRRPCPTRSDDLLARVGSLYASDAAASRRLGAGDADARHGRRSIGAAAARTAPPPARSPRGCLPARRARGSR